jgi:hypothetical protein
VSVPQTALLDADSVLFSQSNVKPTLPDLVDYMKDQGWGELPPIDVVQMPNGTLLAVDNTVSVPQTADQKRIRKGVGNL